MKILWVTGSSGYYKTKTLKEKGGWINALKDALLSSHPEIELGITFFDNTDNENLIVDKVTYLLVKYEVGKTGFNKFLYNQFKSEEKYLRSRLISMAERIRQFQPDVIHVWGIENYYSGVIEFIHDLPIVVHIQGLANACLFTPPCISENDLKICDSWLKRYALKRGVYVSYQKLKDRAEKELYLSNYVINWMGRTEWDCTMSKMLNPQATYYHCEELLRSDFSNSKWMYHYDGRMFAIHSTISGDWYKGLDMILRTAKVLKDYGINVIWNVYGCYRNDKMLHLIIKRFHIIPENVNVIFHGRVDAATIREGLLKCDCFVHPSYIENSSNAIAEAQLLGVPVIAQYVGGNPTMLKENSGILVPSNEPFIMASAILKMRSKTIAEMYSSNAEKMVVKRQDKNFVVNNLLVVYKKIQNKE